MATKNDLDYMKNKICLITGGTSGMGLETARAIAKKGARVVIVGRNKEKCENTVAMLKKETGDKNVEYLLADLSSQKEVRKLASKFKKKYKKLHVLVNNAGGFFLTREKSVDDIEMNFALNYLSYFLLTNLLLDVLKDSAPSRIVNVSSAEHLDVELDFDDLESKNKYNGMKAYSKSKLADIIFTYELHRRLENTGVTANTLHPGWVATNIGKNNGLISKLIVPLIQVGAVHPEKGAQTCIQLACSPDLECVSGKYFDKGNETNSAECSYDENIAKKLWNISEKMTGL